MLRPLTLPPAPSHTLPSWRSASQRATLRPILLCGTGDRRRYSAPCFSKIAFACLAVLTISSALSLLKSVNCVIVGIRSSPLGCASPKSGDHKVGLGNDPKGSQRLGGRIAVPHPQMNPNLDSALS